MQDLLTPSANRPILSPTSLRDEVLLTEHTLCEVVVGETRQPDRDKQNSFYLCP